MHITKKKIQFRLHTSSTLSKILFLILCIWFILSFFRLFYNLTKTIVDTRLFFEGRMEKQMKFFGVDAEFAKIIAHDKKIHKLLLLNEYGRISYFYQRFELYPYVEVVNESKSPNYAKYDAVILYKSTDLKLSNIVYNLKRHFKNKLQISDLDITATLYKN